jgi:cytochrome c biogenesis protein CcmG/thiol:disulfide interchange protein DsbE
VTNQDVTQPEQQRRGSLSSILLIVVGLGFAALLVFGFLSPRTARLEVGEPAPEFTLETFGDSRFSLGKLGGQIVVLNFWASWCSPCREEAPALQAVWQDVQDEGVVFLGITYRDAQSASQEFIETFGITYENGVDAQGRISREYGVVAVPETYIIDRDGNVAWVHIGVLDAATLSQQIKALQTQ